MYHSRWYLQHSSVAPLDRPGPFDVFLITFTIQTAKSLSIIAEAYDNYKPEELCLAFNGGTAVALAVVVHSCIGHRCFGR